jgi:hypothetical protein
MLTWLGRLVFIEMVQRVTLVLKVSDVPVPTNVSTFPPAKV